MSNYLKHRNKESDVDILVELKEPFGLLFIHLADFLKEILGIKVDLLTPDAIKPNRKKYIEVRRQYEIQKLYTGEVG